MKIDLEEIKITEIEGAEYNPRIMPPDELEKLKDSIKGLGFLDPIILNLKKKPYTIIGGHQRVDALDKLGKHKLYLLPLGDIGWAFLDTDLKVKDDITEKAMNLALNKISGLWDLPKLEGLLEEVELSGFQVELTGFDTEDLAKLRMGAEEEVRGMGDFTEIDEDMKTDYCCPKCGYEWSGKPK